MLWRKMLRDLKENKGAYIACGVIIIIGLMAFTAFTMIADNLRNAMDDFYLQENFAEGFAVVNSITQSQVNKLADIEGIDRVEGRIVKDVRVLDPDRADNVYLRLVSIDPKEENPINGIRLIQGIPLTDKDRNIWIDNKFFDANKLSLNGSIDVIVDGKRTELNIVGVGRSPEYVYALRRATDLYPDPERFGIAFVPYEVMKGLFPGSGAINDIVFTFKPGADFDTIKPIMEIQLKPNGLFALYDREDHLSHSLLKMELDGIEGASQGVPILLLSIAGMILYIMLKRIVEQQRGQIGILKAFGYTYTEILFHYLSYGIILGIICGIIGGLLGIALTYPMTAIFVEFFNLPGLTSGFSALYFFLCILLSLFFTTLAGYFGCRGVLKLEPAEAMRPPAPPEGKKVLLERIQVFWNALNVQGKMAVRNIFRNKGRSVFMFIGIMISFAIVTFTWSMNDMTQKLLFDQYEKVETYNVKVSLNRPLNQDRPYQELTRFEGVKRVEPMAEIPITLKNKWHKKDVLLLGIPADSLHYNILDNNYQNIPPPQNGILLSERLAKVLNVDVGSIINIESMLMRDSNVVKQVQVLGIIPQYLGMNAYMELESMRDLLDQGRITTSFTITMDEAYFPQLKNDYRESPIITDVVRNVESMEKSKELMESYGSIIYFYALIGMIIGIAIIYNSTLVALSERSYELASMMVLGMTEEEVRSVITFEQWFISLFSMLIGIPMAKMMFLGMSETMSTDLFTIPSDISNIALIIALIITSGSIWIAQKAGAKKIRKLKLVEVLKSREQ